MGAATSGDYWWRCRHCLQLHLPLHLSLILFCSSCSQWISNDRAGFWIRHGGRRPFKTAERSGSASNAGWGVECNVMHWVCLWGSSGCWCTRPGGWSIYWSSLCSGQGGSHGLSDVGNARIVQRRWGGGLLTLDYRRYGTSSLKRIPLASWYGNMCLSRWKFENSPKAHPFVESDD